MTDRPIPESIEREAWDILQRHRSNLQEGIARALMARDERAARIAREHAQVLRKAYDNHCARAVEGLATAILSEGE